MSLEQTSFGDIAVKGFGLGATSVQCFRLTSHLRDKLKFCGWNAELKIMVVSENDFTTSPKYSELVQ